MHKPLRRTTALASFALVLAPVLSSCGFDYATDREYTPGVGANDRSGDVDVLAGLVVAAESGEAVLVASLSNNSTTDESSLDGLRSADELTFTGGDDVTLPPTGFVNLTKSESPIMVEGDFEAGDFVEVTFDFSHGESITVEVPVVPNCGDYAEIPGVPAGEETCETASTEDH